MLLISILLLDLCEPTYSLWFNKQINMLNNINKADIDT